MASAVATPDAAAALAKARRRLIPFLFLVGPCLLGAISDATHSFGAGLLVIAALMLTGGVLLLSVRQDA